MVDRNSAVPLARQIFDLIHDQINQGRLQPGDRLPTEHELCAQWGVSRKPVRTALTQLTDRGLLCRYPGRGTYVTDASRWRQPIASQTISLVVPQEHWAGPLRAAVESWNREHPCRPLRLTVQPVEFGRLESFLALAVARGAAPDLALIDSVWVAEFAERGYLQPLAAIDATLAARLRADCLPALHARSEYEGRIVALPAEADFSGLWYRKDWFAAEELAPPTSWDELIACGRHFQLPAVRDRYGTGPFPLAFVASTTAGETTTFQLLPVLWSAGADVFAGGQVVLNSPAAIAAVSFIRNLVCRERLVSPAVTASGWQAAAGELAVGGVPMAFGGSYEWPVIGRISGWSVADRSVRLGFLPLPAGPGGAPATLVGGLSYAIFRQSRQPHLALQLLARAQQPDILVPFCEATGQNPPTISGTRHLPRSGSFLSEVAALWPPARARWPLATYPRVSIQLARMFAEVITGRIEPAAAVARTAAMASAITGLPEATPQLVPWVPDVRG